MLFADKQGALQYLQEISRVLIREGIFELEFQTHEILHPHRRGNGNKLMQILEKLLPENFVIFSSTPFMMNWKALTGKDEETPALRVVIFFLKKIYST